MFTATELRQIILDIFAKLNPHAAPEYLGSYGAQIAPLEEQAREDEIVGTMLRYVDDLADPGSQDPDQPEGPNALYQGVVDLIREGVEQMQYTLAALRMAAAEREDAVRRVRLAEWLHRTGLDPVTQHDAADSPNGVVADSKVFVRHRTP